MFFFLCRKASDEPPEWIVYRPGDRFDRVVALWITDHVDPFAFGFLARRGPLEVQIACPDVPDRLLAYLRAALMGIGVRERQSERPCGEDAVTVDIQISSRAIIGGANAASTS